MVDSISSPAVVINNDNITIVPSSLVTNAGKGERNVRAGSNGGGSTTIIVSENAETKKGMIKFSVYPTKEMDENIDTWHDNGSANAISFFDSNTNFNKTMQNATMLKSPDSAYGADTTIEVEFEGDPIV